ncbi:MAG: hypothetical protein AAB358_03770, partial [Patescibacteria group bacterium]
RKSDFLEPQPDAGKEKIESEEGTDELLSSCLDVQKEAELTIDAGRKELELVESKARAIGLTEEQIESVRKDAHIREQLEQNTNEIRQLASETINKIRSLVEVLNDDLSDDEIEKIMESYGINPEVIGSGAFYDTFEINQDEVLKVLKLNYLFNQEQAVRMLARHSFEAKRLRENFGDEFIAQTAFIFPEELKSVYDKEWERVSGGGISLYSLSAFIKIQLDRRLQKRYYKHDVPTKRQGMDRVFGRLGEVLRDSSAFRKECAGVMVEERINGITFGKLMERGPRGGDCKNWEKLKGKVKKFIEKLRSFNEKYAFLWHCFDSDNIMIEIDEQGEPTGEIKIIDLNFTEKSSEIIRRALVAKMEEKIIKPLEDYFEL